MITKTFTNRYVIFLIVFFAFIFIQNTSAQTTSLIEYALTSTINSTNGIASNHPGGSFSTDALNLSFTPGNVAQTTNWDSGTAGGFKSWQTSSFSTIGYHSIKVSAVQYSSSSTGPRDFVLEYKIGDSGTWTSVEDYTVTNTATNREYFLPQACSNESNVSVRWSARSYISLSGGSVAQAAKNFIRTVSVIGTSPITPSTQASQITFSSTSATTLTVGCTPGNGDNRLIVIRKPSDPDFTLPTNGASYTANPVYSGSGQQIVYNGSGNSVVVTVPDATAEYYFRVFEYNQNAGMTRYLTSTATGNPKLYALEEITANPATNIRMVSATLGATIKTPTKGEIYDRGIIWSTSPGVTIDDNMFSDYNPQGGTFALNFPDAYYGTTEFPRGSTIYYKGYVQNESGTILSQEMSFTNVPTFTGTGNWEDAARWNVQQVPGEANAPIGSISDSPIINGTCTLNSSTTCNNLTISTGAGRRLTISPNAQLVVNGNLTNNTNSALVLKAGQNQPNATLVYHGGTPSATVEMYSKANWNLSNPAGSKYKWQYFGIPVQQITAGIAFNFSRAYVREWDESVDQNKNLWIKRNDSTTLYKDANSVLTSMKGYEVVQEAPTTYNFAGKLTNEDVEKRLSYSSSAVYPGQHILANPYTAAIDISLLGFGSETEPAVYLYNTGSYSDWEVNGGEYAPGEGPGTYTVSTPATAGEEGVPSQIPSMQGFLVKAMSNSPNATFSIPYNSVIANNDQQRVRGLVRSTVSNKVVTRIDVKGERFSDRLWIFTDSRCSRTFDRGWDGRKMFGSSQTSQLYAIEENENYQINATDNMNETALGFMAGNDSKFKLTFTHKNLDLSYSKVYLVDAVDNKTIDVTANGSEYEFMANSGSLATQRFKILTNPINPVVTGDKENRLLTVFSTKETVFIQNLTAQSGKVFLFNVSGAMIRSQVFEPNGISTISIQNLPAGTYIVKATTNTQVAETLRVIIR
jgi:hypothetical protein